MTNQFHSRHQLRLKARLRLCSRSTAKQLGVSSRALRVFVSAAISSAFSNLVFLPLLSLVLFVVYMAHYRFFSYDFFAEGVFGMKLFVLAMLVGLVITSFGLFGSGILFYAKRRGTDVPWYMVGGVGLLNLLFLLLFGLTLFNPEGRVFVLFVLVVTFYLAVHFGVFFFAKLKAKVFLLVALFFVAFGLVAAQPELSAKLLGSGLRTFGVGGEIPIEVISEDGSVKAKLILLTPKYVYFIESDGGALSFQALDKVKKIRHVAQPKT